MSRPRIPLRSMPRDERGKWVDFGIAVFCFSLAVGLAIWGF